MRCTTYSSTRGFRTGTSSITGISVWERNEQFCIQLVLKSQRSKFASFVRLSVAFKGYVLPSMNTMGVGWQEWSFYVEQEHPPGWWVGSQFRLRFQLTSPHRLRPHPPLGQDWTRWTRHYHQWQYYLLHLWEGPKWHRGRRKTSMCNTIAQHSDKCSSSKAHARLQHKCQVGLFG